MDNYDSQSNSMSAINTTHTSNTINTTTVLKETNATTLDITASFPAVSSTNSEKKYDTPITIVPGTKAKVVSGTTTTTTTSIGTSYRITEGVLEYDELTSFPYTIMGTLEERRTKEGSSPSCHNLIVCQDMFDTQERFRIFLSSLFDNKSSKRKNNSGSYNNKRKCHLPTSSSPSSLQILLWNYPGQAFTKYPDSDTRLVLNNVFHAKCLDRLLSHVGPEGTNEFDTVIRSSFILGYGYGGAIASLYAATYPQQQHIDLKGLLLVNPLTFIDTHVASILHDCRNVFSYSPETRPDLPIYYYARFLFSNRYLARHHPNGPSLALNLYSAVYNPITLRGRIRLCEGVLQSVDIRPLVKNVVAPVIISIHGSESGLVRPLHGASFVGKEAGRVSYDSIHRAMEGIEKGGVKRSVVIMVEGGHELLLEKRVVVLNAVKQVVFKIGLSQHHHHRHPKTDDTHAFEDGRSGDSGACDGSDRTRKYRYGSSSSTSILENPGSISLAVESSSNILGVNPKNRGDKNRSKSSYNNIVNQEDGVIGEVERISHTKEEALLMNDNRNEADTLKKTVSKQHQQRGVKEKQHKTILSKPDQNPSSKSPPRRAEYMSWRLKRNRKRLARFQRSAQVIQNALRVFMAKTMIYRLTKQTSALMIQRCYRGMGGRILFLQARKTLWAACFVQRSYRGCIGRGTSYGRRLEVQTQIKLARLWRGNASRRLVKMVLTKRQTGAVVFQCLWRRWMAQVIAFHLRRRIDASVTIQRTYRGHVGRHRAGKERERYLFSRNQSSGIVDGRQMLAEHKLHATRLESELSIIASEKQSLESQVANLIEEITSFERTVQRLEKSMHELNSIHDTGTSSTDESNNSVQHALREKKVELDQEFSTVLIKITDRKSQLQHLEEKMARLSTDHRSKMEDLKQLERRLVVLLEAQENALAEIRHRQERRWDGLSVSEGGESNLPQYDGNVKQHVVPQLSTGLKKTHQTEQLMESTETMMKFGFMSMTMTYFTSMNMVKAMKSSISDGDHSSSQYQCKLGRNINAKAVVPAENGYRPNLSSELINKDKINVSCWNVDNVIEWLECISLSQYSDAFRDGAIDGPFLSQLTDDDVRNVLGVEHRLHRKKILFGIKELIGVSSEVNEIEQDSSFIAPGASASGNSRADEAIYVSSNYGEDICTMKYPDQQAQNRASLPPALEIVNEYSMEDNVTSKEQVSAHHARRPLPCLDDLSRWIRSKKVELINEALLSVPSQQFEENNISVQFVEGIGTVYIESLNRESFHMNKFDEYGNTLMHVAAQNGNLRMAKILMGKGANPNHQNKQGQTPGHFAVSYQFYDLARWLFDEDGGGANDLLTNMYGLGPYDGLNEN